MNFVRYEPCAPSDTSEKQNDLFYDASILASIHLYNLDRTTLNFSLRV